MLTVEGSYKWTNYLEDYPRLAAIPMQFLMKKQQKADSIFPIGPE